MFDCNIWKQVQEIDNKDSFVDESDREIFLEYLNNPSMVLMEMANVLGNDVVYEQRLPFSFYFSDKKIAHSRHGIRTKIIWNPSKTPSDADGFMQLHGNYEYISGSHKYKPTNKELNTARNFFKKYKVLFSAVWEEKLDQAQLQKYFTGSISFKELLSKFNSVSEIQYYKLNHANSLDELEDMVRKYKIYNMND